MPNKLRDLTAELIPPQNTLKVQIQQVILTRHQNLLTYPFFLSSIIIGTSTRRVYYNVQYTQRPA